MISRTSRFIAIVAVYLLVCCAISGAASPTSKLPGVCFGPYLTGSPDRGDVVSQDNLRTYLGYIAANFNSCRTYGSLSGLENFPAVAKGLGLKVAAGCWLSTNSGANEAEIKALISNCRSGNVDIAIVGSETLLRNDLTETQLLGYISRVKATGVKVTTAEEWHALVAHPNIIAACDEIWANIYPFWEGVAIDNAMAKLQSGYEKTKVAAGSKTVVISETGWPSAGEPNQLAIPSEQNEATYFGSLAEWAKAQGVEYYYFEAFDESWKTEPGLVGPHWGIWNAQLQIKPGLDRFIVASIVPRIVQTTPKIQPIKPAKIVSPKPVIKPLTAKEKVAITKLGRLIRQQQMNVVKPGGDEWSPGFTWVDKTNFEKSGRLKKIIKSFKSSRVFSQGVVAIRKLPKAQQENFFTKYANPVYPTWAMNGRIDSSGTTDAGYEVEEAIANALTKAVKAAL